MTSRDTTRLLARSHPAGALGTSTADWMHILLFGAIGWPWLVRSLSGGRPRDKRALLDRLDLPADALPHLGSWKADTGLLSRIVGHIERTRPQSVVELGAGASTLVTARALQKHGGGRLLSFDQHPDFVAATRQWLADYGLEADMRAVDLVPSHDEWPGYWYDLNALPQTIDLLIVDGPPWTLHPYVRGAADRLFDRMPVGGTVMLDDGARPGERIVAALWREKWPNFEFRLENNGTKGTLIGTRTT